MNIINGKTYPDGNISVINDVIYINGKKVDDNDSIFTEKKIIITCETCGAISSQHSVDVKGNITGNVNARGSISCDRIDGSVDCGGSVNCDDIGGNVNAGGSVNCDDIKGSVKCGGSLRCGSYGM